MPVAAQDGTNEAEVNNTPSTASRIKQSVVENAFPTPPRRSLNSKSLSRTDQALAPAMKIAQGSRRAASTPPECRHQPSRQLYQQSLEARAEPPRTSELKFTQQKQDLAKRTSQFFEKTLAIREPSYSAKERVARDSLVLAEIRMNSCLEKEQEFLIDFSCRLAEIYQRSTSCIVIVVSTNAFIMMGGSADAAYYLTITALAPEIAATKNKRGTAMIQDFLWDMLQIPSTRGVVKFEAIQEQNLATNGCTVMQEIEKLERQSMEERRTARSKKAGLPFTSEYGDSVAFLARSSLHADDGLPSRIEAVPTLRGRKLTHPLSRKIKPRKSIMAFLKLGKGEGAN